jgi:hypothetical protein
MILEKRTHIEGSFEELVKQAEHGDKILLLEGDTSHWEIDYNSYLFYHSRLGTIYRNGQPFLKGVTGKWAVYSKGILLLEDKCIRNEENRDKALYKGEYSQCEEVDGKLVIRKGSVLRVNGKTPIYEEDMTDEFEFRSHPLGFVIVRWKTVYLNGTKEIFTFKHSVNKSWCVHERGIAIHRDHTFYVNDCLPIYSDWCTTWVTHRDGLVIEQNDRVYFVVLKPNQTQSS